MNCRVDVDELEVILGRYDRKEDDELTQIMNVSQIVRFNDTAGDTILLKLSSRANIRGDAVGVVDLVSSRRDMNRARRNEMECVQAGWGRQGKGSTLVFARFLRAIGVNFVNNTEVVRRGYSNYLKSGHIGTEAEYTNECELDGMCSNDEGAPVVCRRNKKRNWILTAMFAFSDYRDGCMTGIKASKNVLDIYDWVQSTISG